MKRQSESTHAGNRVAGLPTERQFFIVGAPRCGTTALSRYLAKHPQVCFSKPKEPHFFSDSTLQMDRLDLRKDYIKRYFAHYDPSHHKVLGEGSVSYLYSPDAVRRILGINPQAKFIITVRNPIDMVRSYHARMLYTLDETESDFSQAWALQDARAKGQQVPKFCRDPRMLQYHDIGLLGQNVQKLFEIAGRERCKVVVFDDLSSDPLKTYRDILAFVELEYDGQTRFTRKRKTRNFRHPLLQRLMVRPPRGVIASVRLMQKLIGAERLDKRLRLKLKRMNTASSAHVQLDSALRQTLTQHFAADVTLLAQLLDRDLSPWLATGQDSRPAVQ